MQINNFTIRLTVIFIFSVRSVSLYAQDTDSPTSGTSHTDPGSESGAVSNPPSKAVTGMFGNKIPTEHKPDKNMSPRDKGIDKPAKEFMQDERISEQHAGVPGKIEKEDTVAEKSLKAPSIEVETP